MSGIIFSSETSSLSAPNPIRYKAEVSGEDYVGLFDDIIGGTGNTFYVAGDWRDFLLDLQTLKVIEIGVSFQTTSTLSFSYNEAEDRTEIVTSIAFESKWDTIEATNFAPIFEPNIKELTTEWEDQGDILLGPIKESHSFITYYNNDAWFDRFSETFIESNDDQWKLVIYRRNDADTEWDLEWVGNMVIDGLEWDNMDKPRPYTFRAIDGINMLKNVPYDEALTGSTSQPLIAHLITALGYINTQQFWGGSDAYIRESNEYVSTDIAGLTDSDSVFEYAFFDDRVFIELDNDDTLQGMDVYNVIVSIMEILSCRIFLAQGIWWVQQVRNFDNPTVIVFREFTTSIGAASSRGQYNHKKTVGQGDRAEDLVQMVGGKFNNHEGLLNVKIVAEQPGLVQSIVSDTIGRLSHATTTFQRVYELGRTSGGVGTDAKIRIEFLVDELINPDPLGTYFFECRLQITTPPTANDFIKGSDVIDPFWSSGVIITNRFWSKKITSVQKGGKTLMVYETPEIPFDDDVTITLDFFLTGNTTVGFEYWRIHELRTFIPSDDGDIADIEYNVGNPNSNFTKELDLGTLIIDDESKLVAVNALQVDEEFTSASPRNLIKSTVWDADFDVDGTLTETRAVEAMSLQFKAIQILRSNIEGDYYPFYSLDYNDKIYVFAGFKFNYTTDEQDGEWFELATARGGVSSSVIKIFKNPGPGTTSGEGEKWQNDGRDNTLSVITANGTTPATGGDIGTIAINAPGHSRVKAGDTMDIVHIISNAIVETVVVASDVDPSDTVMGIVEQTIVNDITDQMLFVFKKGEVVEANIIRADTFIDKDTGLQIGIPAGSDTEVQTNDGGVFGAFSEFRFNGSTKTLLLGGNAQPLSSRLSIRGPGGTGSTLSAVFGDQNGATALAISDDLKTDAHHLALSGGSATIAALTIEPQTAISGTPDNGALRNEGTATLMYFDGTTDFNLLAASGGDVSKVGTPVNDQVAVWVTDNTIEGTTNFTWDEVNKRLRLNGSTLTAVVNIKGKNVSGGSSSLLVENSVGSLLLDVKNNGTFNIFGRFDQIGLGNSLIMGVDAGLLDDGTDNRNVYLGYKVALVATTAAGNVGIGREALNDLTTGSSNLAIGPFSLDRLTSGSFNVGIGSAAGKFIADGSTSNLTPSFSVFIGTNTKALANGQTNQVVIGRNTIGGGSNTVSIGNSSILETFLRGTLNIQDTPTSSAGLNAGDVWSNSGVLTLV